MIGIGDQWLLEWEGLTGMRQEEPTGMMGMFCLD